MVLFLSLFSGYRTCNFVKCINLLYGTILQVLVRECVLCGCASVADRYIVVILYKFDRTRVWFGGTFLTMANFHVQLMMLFEALVSESQL